VVRRPEERHPDGGGCARRGHADPGDADPGHADDAGADHDELTAGVADPDDPGAPDHATDHATDDAAADDDADDGTPDDDDHSALVGRRWGSELLRRERVAAGVAATRKGDPHTLFMRP
jgi:hypothetical protein